MFISVGPASSFQSASLISHVQLPYLSPLSVNHASFTLVPLPLRSTFIIFREEYGVGA